MSARDDLTYQEHVNGYQTVCQGRFAPYPYLTPPDLRGSGT
jgi:hypothetical protein